MVDILAPVTFGEGGPQGPAGSPGAAGPAGALGGVPDVNGLVVLNSNTVTIQGPFTRESAGKLAGAGTGLKTIAAVQFNGIVPSKIVFEASAKSADLTKTQTLDGARKIHYVGSVPTLVVSGTDVPDDGDALGVTFNIELYLSNTALRVTATSATTGLTYAAAIRELL